MSRIIKKAVPKTKKYNRPEPVDAGTVFKDFNRNNWHIGQLVGVGGFADIYEARAETEPNYNCVVKLEPYENGPLYTEWHFYMRRVKLEDIESYQRERQLTQLGMPHMLGSGTVMLNGKKQRFLVLPRYDIELGKHIADIGGQLTETLAYTLAIQLLDVYEYIHRTGYMYGDLKAANIMLEWLDGDASGPVQAYLLDYGMVMRYTLGAYKPDRKLRHNGTVEYCARDLHQGVPTMRADLETLGYNLMQWLGVQLPWIAGNMLQQPIKVQKCKEQFMENLQENLDAYDVPLALGAYLQYVYELEYNEQPEYDQCRNIFRSALEGMSNVKLKPQMEDLIKKPRKRKAATASYAKLGAPANKRSKQLLAGTPTKVVSPGRRSGIKTVYAAGRNGSAAGDLAAQDIEFETKCVELTNTAITFNLYVKAPPDTDIAVNIIRKQ